MSDIPVSARPVTVDREVPVNYDLGNLALYDSNMLDAEAMKSEAAKEAHLTALARDSAQLLVNQLLAQPVVTGGRTGGDARTSEGVFVKLPDTVYQLPREKPVPTPKPPTKWEKFAKQKGITKERNTGNQVYDEATGEWVKKWGYKGKNQDAPWIVEVDANGEAVDEGQSKKKKREEKPPSSLLKTTRPSKRK
ncbi:ribosomal biogenesis regulatory protein [Myxozyma melibiosi]|uniref:Ribosome biogenesis regulatory protein n=1 Tax=Myxozyma melibiosi TaxID=54550 RepID=A0ABR1FDW5_9ASCO